MDNNLNYKVNKGVKWTLIKALVNSTIQPLYRILLGVLLIPTEFAYIAVITLIVSFAEILNNAGIGEAIIQRDNVSKEDLSSLFFFNLFLSITVTATLYISSDVISNYYDMKDLSPIIKFLTIIVLSNGITSLFKFYLHKEFHFKQTSVLQILKILTEVAITLIFIIMGYGIWGFAIGIVISNLLHAALLAITVFVKSDFKLQLYFSFSNLRRFWSFGIFIASKKILTFFSHRIDEILIGGLLTPEILGSYFFAKSILLQLQTLITASFSQVLLPTFSKLKDNLVMAKKYYLKIFSTLTFLGLPIFTGLILVANFFVPVIFGDKWSNSVLVFQLLSFPILAELLMAGIATSLLYSQEKSLLVLIIDLCVVFPYIIILLIFGNSLLSVIFIYSLYICTKFILIQFSVGKITNIKINDYKIIRGPLISTLVMSVTVLFQISYMQEQFSNFYILITSILLGTSIYTGSSFIINKKQTVEVFVLFKNLARR